jgi:hypothetical protein
MKAYQLKIALRDVKPPVWRRVVVPAGISFDRLKTALTKAMGWDGGYFYVFCFEEENRLLYRAGEEDLLAETLPESRTHKKEDARAATIDDRLVEGATFRFEYDFSHAWIHDIEVEKTIEDYPNDCPRVIKYAGECPPEELDGPEGYAKLLKEQADPSDPEHENAMRWHRLRIEYDMEAVNDKLAALFARNRGDVEGDAAAEGRSDKRAENAFEEGNDADGARTTPVGPHSFLLIADRMRTMSEEELRAAFENPETLFGYHISKRKPVLTLRGLFDSLRLKDLQTRASEIELPGRSRMKKDALIDALYDRYVESKLLHLIMNRMNDKEMHVLHSIMRSGVYYVDDADFPYDFALGLLYHHIITAFYRGNRIVIVAFREFRKKYLEALDELKDLFSNLLKKVDEYACAAVNLYGAIPMEEFMRIYRERGESDLNESTVRRILLDLIGEEADSEIEYRLRGDILFSDELNDWEDDELADLIERSRVYPLFVPPTEQFLAYADWLYFEETPAHEKFVEFLQSKEGRGARDKAAYKLLVGELCSVLRQWAPMQECFDILESFDIKLRDLKDIKLATKLLTQMRDHTRVWGKNGATLIELRSYKPANTTTYRSPNAKIGRNDPCPCGSGKKYKHCCGKLLQ